MLTIDIDIARRFILSKQGLWPGRRWRGITGAEQAMRAMEYLQLDPLQIIARSHDITLHNRVLDYTPGIWENAAYEQRKFFDWGGWGRPPDGRAASLACSYGPRTRRRARLRSASSHNGPRPRRRHR